MDTYFKHTICLVTLLTALSQNSSFAATNIYANTQAGMLAPAVKAALYRVYVPNRGNGTVTIIDPLSYKVIDNVATGKNPQHVVPSYDLQTLWVLNDKSDTITAIDPNTSKAIKTISVQDPFNLYFTADGKYAMVISDGRRQIQIRDPKTMDLLSTIRTSCTGANHMEITADGHYGIVTCEYSGQLMKLDLEKFKVVGYLSLRDKPTKRPEISPEFTINSDGQATLPELPMANSMPQDIRSTADGKYFYVADMMKDGVNIIDPVKFVKVGFIPTGVGTHAIYPSRDGKLFYVSNRGCRHSACQSHGQGTISVIDPAKQVVVANWAVPHGGSPDTGNITPDGKELWLSGRYDKEVYVFNTKTGNLAHRIPVGDSPHGLAVWPQPGQYSLGHTDMR